MDSFVHNCMEASPARAGMKELHVIARSMRRLKVEVQLYPLGTADGGMTHFVMIMEEMPMCPALPQAGTCGSNAGRSFCSHAGLS